MSGYKKCINFLFLFGNFNIYYYMKSIKKVIDDRINKIKENNISIIDYYSHGKIRCACDYII